MGKKKNDKLARHLEGLVATAQDAADRAEKAAKKARKHRRRIEEQAAAAPRSAPESTREAAPGTAPESPAAASVSVPTSDLQSATKQQLLDLARAAAVPGRTRMSREELVAALGR